MTILEPTLYANGALRLTDHGPRGGLVLMHVPTGAQCTIDPGARTPATRYIATSTAALAEQDFNIVAERYGDPARSEHRVYGGRLYKVRNHRIVPA